MRHDPGEGLTWRPTMLPLASVLSGMLWALMFWMLPLSTVAALVAATMLLCSAIALKPRAACALAHRRTCRCRAPSRRR